jgi:hypothetical protein
MTCRNPVKASIAVKLQKINQVGSAPNKLQVKAIILAGNQNQK